MNASTFGLVLLACIGSSLALQCFECDSVKGITGSACADPFMPTGNVKNVTCEANEVCEKSRTEALGIVNFARKCTALCEEKDFDVAGVKMETKCCSNVDFCNGAVGGHVDKVVATVLSLCAVLYML